MAKDLRYYLKFDSNGQKVMRSLGVSAEQLDKALEGVTRRSVNARKNMLQMASVTVVVDGVASAVAALQGAMADLSAAYRVQVEAETKLETVMRQRMAATDAQIQRIKDLASAQQEAGVIGDEVQLAGAQQLATFLNQTATLEQLIPAMNNLVAQQKGYSATASDAVTVANLMGKAMQGQASALKRVGITFTEMQQAMLENGNEAQRAAMLAQIITDNVGQMNAALAATDTGKMKQLENTLGDVKEKLGSFVQGALPFVTMGNQAVMAASNIIKLSTGVKAAAVAVANFTGVSQLCSLAMGAMRAASLALGTGLVRMGASATAARAALNGFKTALIGTGIGAALVLVGSLAAKYLELSNATQRAARAAATAKEINEAGTAASIRARAQLTEHIARLKEFKGTKEEELKLVAEMNEAYSATMGYFSSVEQWYKTLTENSQAYCRQMVVEAKTRALASKIAEKEQERHDILYDENGDRKLYSTQRKKTLKIEGPVADPTHFGASFVEVAGTSDKEKADAKLVDINADLKNLNRQLSETIAEAASLKMTVTGSKTPTPTPTPTPSPAVSAALDDDPYKYTTKGQFDALAKLISAAKDAPDTDSAFYAKLEKLEQTLNRAFTYFQRGISAPTKGDLLPAVNIPAQMPGLGKKRVTAAEAVPVELPSLKTARPDIDALKQYENAIGKVQQVWSGLSGISSGMDAITKSIEGNGNAWEKLSGILGGTLQIFQAVGAIMGVINPLINANNTLTAKSAGEKLTDAAAAQQQTAANVTAAASGALAANSSIPVVGIAMGVAAVAAIVAAMISLPKFAKGGIAFGPTLGVFGEYSGAANNPEVVAPLSRLKEFIQPQPFGDGRLTARVKGRDLEFVYEQRKQFNSSI